MSLKFEPPLYKVYEPGYHTQQPIIVDEDIGSPDALDIRLRVEAAQGDGGGLLHRVESPPGLPHMSAYKPQAPGIQGFPESPYSQYSTQSFSTQHTENAASINQMAFAANSAAGQYASAQPSLGASVSLVSCHPTAGTFGTKVFVKISSQYDLLVLATPTPYFSIVFGSQRSAGQIVKDSQESTGGYTYTITAEAPQALQTGCPNLSNVPLTLLVESAEGEQLARVPDVGIFSYHEGQGGGTGGGVGVGGPGDTSPHEPVLGTRMEPPEQRSPPHSLHVRDNNDGPASPNHGLTAGANTNTYAYPPGVGAVGVAQEPQVDSQAQGNFAVTAPGAYSQGDSSMMGSYRGPSYTDHYHRAASQTIRSPHSLRSPHQSVGWSTYGSHIDSLRSPSAMSHAGHTSITRPGLSALPQPGGAPHLVRTTTLTQSSASSSGYSHYANFPAKATLRIHGNLESMTENWTQDEWDNKRRIVQFKRSLQGNQLSTSFRALSASEQPQNSICISCIWWEEKQECFVTSVDTIHLLEQLVAHPNRFSVEEKNRIRRNLEGFHPLTISKAKPETEEFFKLIMSFGNPKPRRIEKDVKVFQWKILGPALKKIISKYSASPASTVSAGAMTHPVTPVSMSGSYPNLPPMPRPSLSGVEPGSMAGYDGSTHHHHHNEQSSASRSISGGASWGAYAGPSKTMSPGLKMGSPITSSGLRIPALPAVYDSRPTSHSLASPYTLSAPSHHSSHHHQPAYSQPPVPVSSSHGRSWDAYTVADPYPSTSTHAHASVYSTGAYGEGTQRA